MLASVIPIFSGAAYLTGLTYHNAYLYKFGIPENLLGKTAANYFLYAYQAVAESGLRMISITGVAVIGLIIFAIYFWQIIGWLEQVLSQSRWMQKLHEKVRSKPKLRILGKVVIVPVIVMMSSYLFFVVFFVFLAPQIIGHQAGVHRAEEDLLKFNRGCEKNIGIPPLCNEIYDGVQPIANGFVVESSEKYVAIYENGIVRTLPLGDKSFVAVLDVKKP